MKVAYLILAHNTPNHTKRLIRALDSPNASFVIHVDRKSDIRPFRDGMSQGNVTFLDERFAVYWGEFPIIPATIRLIEEGLRHKPDYLCLLSGSDYPIRRPAYIERFLSQSRGREFISLVEIPCEEVGKPIGRIADYWLQTPYNNVLLRRTINRLNHLNRRLGVRRNYTKRLDGLVPYAGSTWWALTADACKHILDFVRTRPDVMQFMRNVPNPDESFFQIVIGNSPFAPRVHRNLTFTDWTRPECLPALIDMEHLQTFLNEEIVIKDDRYGRSEVLFARKFPDDSEELTNFIDSQFLERL